jgi:hypothetical protein
MRPRAGEAGGVRDAEHGGLSSFPQCPSTCTQQAFLAAHELVFSYSVGVLRNLRYDNFTSAANKILRGHRRRCPPVLRCKRKHTPAQSSCGTRGGAWRGKNAVIAVSSRFSNWSTTSMFCIANPVRQSDPSRWNKGGTPVCLATEFPPNLASADGAAWEAERDEAHDRVAQRGLKARARGPLL